MNILERASLLLKNLFDQQTESSVNEEHVQPIEMATGPKETLDDNTEIPAHRTLSEADQRFVVNLEATITRLIPNPDLDVEMLAREMAMSHTIFYERVRRVIGITPCNLIKEARMQRAHHLLTTTQSTVAEVADQCGFTNWRYFSTVYKKHWGHSPSKEQDVKTATF